jgi:hypothetical protein
LVWPKPLRLHALRGSFTAKRLNVDQVVLADPGILASLLIDPPVKSAAVAVVPHYRDARFASSLAMPHNWLMVLPEQPVLHVLRQIASAEIVLSSSLHGLIVADAFGIPCVWAQARGVLKGTPSYKFNDYATSRLRPMNDPIAYERAMSLGFRVLQETATRPERDLCAWQQALINVFPFR